LRHTNASLLLEQGVDFKIIQEQLGHSDIGTTLNIYSHATTEMQKSASKKLSDLFSPNKKIASERIVEVLHFLISNVAILVMRDKP